MDHAVIDVGETKTMARSIAFSVNGREDITSACDTLSTAIESKGYSLNTRLTFDETTQVFAVRRFNDKESVTFNQFDAVHTMGERWCEVWIEVDDESRSLSE